MWYMYAMVELRNVLVIEISIEVFVLWYNIEKKFELLYFFICL